MTNDARILDSLYRQRSRSDKALGQIDENISAGGDDEELSRVFDQLMQEKIVIANSYAVTSVYVNYKHETLKNAINVA
ncbi:hypothetical protein VRC24_03310 [Pseudomonas poae]|uniref:hypothetical protein n=1 Tax=Pseudomonas poae TaxID=200451 RepID=UPI0030D04643